jgi:hypothetical protein
MEIDKNAVTVFSAALPTFLPKKWQRCERAHTLLGNSS